MSDPEHVNNVIDLELAGDDDETQAMRLRQKARPLEPCEPANVLMPQLSDGGP